MHLSHDKNANVLVYKYDYNMPNQLMGHLFMGGRRCCNCMAFCVGREGCSIMLLTYMKYISNLAKPRLVWPSEPTYLLITNDVHILPITNLPIYLSPTYHSWLDATKLDDKNYIFHLFIQIYNLMTINNCTCDYKLACKLNSKYNDYKNNLFIIFG